MTQVLGGPLTEQSTSSNHAQFQSLLAREANDEEVVREAILHGETSALPPEQHYAVKQKIARHLEVDVNTEVFVVGSAKLGFSIAPHKRFREFGDTSDVDVAIVSHSLYESIWHEVHAYRESGADWPRQHQFEQYLAWGWIRPDMLPRSVTFARSNEWWTFFRSLQAERVAGPYKVAGAIYHDISFLLNYQGQAVAACRQGEI